MLMAQLRLKILWKKTKIQWPIIMFSLWPEMWQNSPAFRQPHIDIFHIEVKMAVRLYRMGQVESSNIAHPKKMPRKSDESRGKFNLFNLFGHSHRLDKSVRIAAPRGLGVTVFHCCRRMLWPGCRKVQNPLCKALIWDLIWSISDCSSWNLIWMLRTMNFYIWFEQSKLIPLFEDESGTLSLPDHCLFWPDQRLDVSQSKCKLGYPPVVKRGMLENPPFIEDGLLEFWNLHIYSGFSSTPCSCLHRKFLVLAGNDGHRDCLGHFWGDHWAHVSGGLARHWSSQTMADRTAWSNYCSEQKPSECAGMTGWGLQRYFLPCFKACFKIASLAITLLDATHA